MVARETEPGCKAPTVKDGALDPWLGAGPILWKGLSLNEDEGWAWDCEGRDT